MVYRYSTTSVQGFIQQLAVQYLTHGYFFFVRGVIPEGKDPEKVDDKLLRKYGVSASKWAKARRKKEGSANVHYLRFSRFFVLLSTHGRGSFFDEEPFQDARETPIRFAGYSVSFRGGHAHVRIEKATYLELRARFEELALGPADKLTELFRNLPYEPYAPVRRQFFSLLGHVNRRRKIASLEPISWSCLRLRRRVVRPFDPSVSALPREIRADSVPALLNAQAKASLD